VKVWPKVRLDECSRIVAGATPSTSVEEYWNGDICWATPKDLSELDGPFLYDTPRKITTAGLQNSAAEILPIGSVLFSSRAPIGHVAINRVPTATNQGFKSFVPDPRKLNSEFLFHWLRANRSYLENLGNGATFKEVSKATVSRIEIALPPLSEQERIASVLNQAAALRAKRHQALHRLDILTHSLFLNRFGDPATNPKGWELRELAAVGRVITGNTPSRENPQFFGNDIEWIKSDNLNTPYHYLSKAEEGLSQEGKGVARVAPPGSVLVTCIAGSPSCIGNAAIADREVAFNQQINALVPRDPSDTCFLYVQFLVGKKLIQQASTSGMKGMVNKSRFEGIKFIWPPQNERHDFGISFLKLNAIREKQQISATKLDALFASLQHRAFRGEL
jgi:type I restriction enzyme S subunit